MNFFEVVQHVYCAKFMLTVSHNVRERENTQKILINNLNQNVNMTKPTRIVDNSRLLRQYKWNTIKIQLLQLIINAPYGVNFMSILTFSSVTKKESVIERLFWQ